MMMEENKVIEDIVETDSEKIKRLEAQVFQLKNIILKLTGQKEDKPRHSKNGRPFDFSLYTKRHVALHICYFGWDYHGFAVQEITGKTIESELFNALTLTKLIKCREESNYHRCGRTDKGVSAFQQVITIDLRSNLLDGPGVIKYEGCRAEERVSGNSDPITEINYCKIINANLPSHIQVIGWAPCPRPDFSARFDCTSRMYKYYFPRGDLNLSRMNAAGAKLIGEHDYRNFCKMDVGNGVVNYHRRITLVEAKPLVDNASPFDMCVLCIKGKAFLWHQIRCIVSVLFRVASHKEEPDIVSELLDIEANPRRPQYHIASEIPLNLFQCDYDDQQLVWSYDEEALSVSVRQIQDLWAEHAIKATMFKEVIDTIHDKALHSGISGLSTKDKQADALYSATKSKSYISLKEMMKCPSLDEKLSSSVGKRRKIVKE